MNEVAWDTRASNEQKCDNCQCVLTLFTGIHQMKKTKERKVVCGMCAAQLEAKGWTEYGVDRFK